ncbi:MAG: flavin reductase (DIM6/NTAB) family NADH-FMN oxidoreductase RutF [Granulosicoccus sp.]|jgi:flavin reductase (DIM6/NTAB) family NADH-FMN oxidoreductase RutF
MVHFSQSNIDGMEQRYRANFINSLSGFKSANLVGTVNQQRQTNLSIISSAFHIGAEPALMGFINRPHSVDRHTLENLIETGYYTLNHVHTGIIDQAHQTSARYTRDESEFTATGLTPLWHDEFTAPFVSESFVRIGLQYKEHHTLMNNTVMVLGEIVMVDLPQGSVKEDGLVDMAMTNTVAISGLDSYHSPKKVKRLGYAKPHQPVCIIER